LVPPSSFGQAKKLALSIYADHRSTFYCGCEYSAEKRVLAARCGYSPRNHGARSTRVEWEHIVPAFAFGAHRQCWTEKLCRDSKGKQFKGRSCCRRSDPEFRRMEADLQNLAPEIGELNADRSHFAFGEVEGEPRAYGRCDFEVDRQAKTVEPATALRGDIARAYLYMHRAYGPDAFPLSAFDIARFERWHRADPATGWERIRDARIAQIQGIHNPLLRE
jgi:deoxyribonuclease I